MSFSSMTCRGTCHASVSLRVRPALGYAPKLAPALRVRRALSLPRRLAWAIKADPSNGSKQGEADEEPIWARSEKFAGAGLGTPSLGFGVYLLGSAIVSIAAVGSIFEFANKKDLFGLIPPESPLWAPILLFFAVTGLPSAGFLFVKAVNAANKESERLDKLDGQ
ncbi:CGL139 [Auxenochlorella protothecoides x Auxenochlorella symbiontica]